MSFEHIRAAALRQAIIDTTNAIRGGMMGPTPEPLRSEFQAHLKELLVAERSILATDRAAPTTEKPWYPDSSGEWVEVPDDLMGVPKELKESDAIEYLMLGEREDKDFTPCYNLACDVSWDLESNDESRIVAYKKVKV